MIPLPEPPNLLCCGQKRSRFQGGKGSLSIQGRAQSDNSNNCYVYAIPTYLPHANDDGDIDRRRKTPRTVQVLVPHDAPPCIVAGLLLLQGSQLYKGRGHFKFTVALKTNGSARGSQTHDTQITCVAGFNRILVSSWDNLLTNGNNPNTQFTCFRCWQPLPCRDVGWHAVG